MALLQVSPDLLVSLLFPGTAHPVQIVDARFGDGTIELEVKGLDVPEVARVIAVVRQFRLETTFEPI